MRANWGFPGICGWRTVFFSGALFVGDSVTRKLELYVRNQRKTNPGLLGDARFFSIASLGSGNLQKPVSPKSAHPKLNGQKMLLEDAVTACGAKKLYIMLGMNDIAVYGIQGSVDNLMALDRQGAAEEARHRDLRGICHAAGAGQGPEDPEQRKHRAV